MKRISAFLGIIEGILLIILGGVIIGALLMGCAEKKAFLLTPEVFKSVQHNICYEGGLITLDGEKVGNVGENSLEEVLGEWQMLANSAPLIDYTIVDNCLVILPKEVQ